MQCMYLGSKLWDHITFVIIICAEMVTVIPYDINGDNTLSKVNILMFLRNHQYLEWVEIFL